MLIIKQELELYIMFFKMGALTFGGGQAMLPLIQKEAVDIKKWVTEEEMLDVLTVAQVLPGIGAINCATSLGYKLCGVKGAFAATLGIITPPIITIMIVATFLSNIENNIYVQKAFNGVRASIVATIMVVFLRMYKSMNPNKLQLMLFVLTLILVLFLHIEVPYVIVGGAVFSMINGCFLASKNKIK